MNKNLTNIKTEYFLIVNGVKQLFCYDRDTNASINILKKGLQMQSA